MSNTAYLVVICNPETNAIEETTIWSTPEWEQSRRLNHPTFVAWSVTGTGFQNAIDMMISDMIGPHCRYSWLLQYMKEVDLKSHLSRAKTWRSFGDCGPLEKDEIVTGGIRIWYGRCGEIIQTNR